MVHFSIHSELKKLRNGNGFTLKELSSRVGYGTGNLSSYETGKLRAKDPTLLRILTRGYKLSQQQARQQIALWRKSELEESYNMALSQEVPPYNERNKTLEHLLAEEGLNRTDIAKVKAVIKKLKTTRNKK